MSSAPRVSEARRGLSVASPLALGRGRIGAADRLGRGRPDRRRAPCPRPGRGRSPSGSGWDRRCSLFVAHGGCSRYAGFRSETRRAGPAVPRGEAKRPRPRVNLPLPAHVQRMPRACPVQALCMMCASSKTPSVSAIQPDPAHPQPLSAFFPHPGKIEPVHLSGLDARPGFPYICRTAPLARRTMAKPVIGIIGNAHTINDQYPVQAVGVSDVEAVAELTGALPLVGPALPLGRGDRRPDRGLRRLRLHRRTAERAPEPLRPRADRQARQLRPRPRRDHPAADPRVRGARRAGLRHLPRLPGVQCRLRRHPAPRDPRDPRADEPPDAARRRPRAEVRAPPRRQPDRRRPVPPAARRPRGAW